VRGAVAAEYNRDRYAPSVTVARSSSCWGLGGSPKALYFVVMSYLNIPGSQTGQFCTANWVTPLECKVSSNSTTIDGSVYRNNSQLRTVAALPAPPKTSRRIDNSDSRHPSPSPARCRIDDVVVAYYHVLVVSTGGLSFTWGRNDRRQPLRIKRSPVQKLSPPPPPAPSPTEFTSPTSRRNAW